MAPALAALLTAKPFLKGAPAPGGTGFDGGARPNTAGITRASLKGMTPQQVAALDPKAVHAALAAK